MPKLHLVMDVSAGETILLNLDRIVSARRSKNKQSQETGCTVKLTNGDSIHIGLNLDQLLSLLDQNPPDDD
jgi:hypothetical protein